MYPSKWWSAMESCLSNICQQRHRRIPPRTYRVDLYVDDERVSYNDDTWG